MRVLITLFKLGLFLSVVSLAGSLSGFIAETFGYSGGYKKVSINRCSLIQINKFSYYSYPRQTARLSERSVSYFEHIFRGYKDIDLRSAIARINFSLVMGPGFSRSLRSGVGCTGKERPFSVGQLAIAALLSLVGIVLVATLLK